MRFTAFSTLGAGLIISLSNLNGVKAIEATALYTDAVTYCSEAKSVLINEFDIQYHRANNSATFQISAASVQPNLNLRANIYANAYGRNLINVTIDLCDYLQGVLCPLPMINFTGYGTYPIPTSYTSGIPSLAWTVPDIEAFARITLTNTQTGETAACLQTTLSNGLTTRLLAVKWASAGLVIAAILVGLFHSTLRWSPSPAVYRWYDVLYLFQATASSALLEINYPSVYTNFALNFPWALGLFPSTGIQDAVTDLRNSTGGKLPTMAFSAIDYINRKSSPYNEAIALNSFFSLNSTAADFHSFAALTSPVDHLAAATSLARRAEIPTVSQQDTISTVTNGIPVYVNSVGIPTASAFDSIFIIYLISIAVVLAAHVVWGLIVFLADRFRSPENRGTGWVGHQRRGFWSFFAGNMMRVCLIFLFPVFIFSLYQFDIGRKDSWLSILLAALCFAWTVIGLTAVLVFAILRHRRRHTELSATSPLYTRYAWFNSAGMIYRQYRPRYHFWWFAPLALASFVRACFIAFGHGNPWAQVIGLVVVEFLVLVTCIGFRPHKDKKGDWLGATLALFRMVGFGLMIAWIPSMDVDPIIRTILGFVALVMFALPVVLLFFGLLFNLAYGYAFRRHKRRIEDGTEIMPLRHVSDVDSETPAMVQVGTGITPLGSQDGSGIVNAGNGYRPTTMNDEMRQSYHPSIDGDGPGYQRDSYAAYATGYQPNHQDAYDGYTNHYPTQESTGSAYGGNGDRLEGYGGYGGYPSRDAQAAYASVGQGGGQRYPDTYDRGHDQTMPGFHNRRSYADI